jgi:hypothetical protein
MRNEELASGTEIKVSVVVLKLASVYVPLYNDCMRFAADGEFHCPE